MFEKKKHLANTLFDKKNITIIYLKDELPTIFFVADTSKVNPIDVAQTIREEGMDVVEDSIRAGYYATSSWLKHGYWAELVSTENGKEPHA